MSERVVFGEMYLFGERLRVTSIFSYYLLFVTAIDFLTHDTRKKLICLKADDENLLIKLNGRV